MSAPPAGNSSDVDQSSESDLDAIYSEYRTQEHFFKYVRDNREDITSLNITADEVDESEALDFQSVGLLPNLTSLELEGIAVASLVFTTANTPNLRSITLFSVGSAHEDGLDFELELPELRSLHVSHVSATGSCNFGLSLSRCPKLKEVTTYKFRFLSGPNYCVLPNCARLRLHRSEGTDRLEILQAPRLKNLSVQAAYSLHHLRLWDFPCKIDSNDVEALTTEYEMQEKRARRNIDRIAEKWRNGTYGGMEAYRKGWIERDEIDDFNLEEDVDFEMLFLEEMDVELETRLNAIRSALWVEFVEKLSHRPDVDARKSLPQCTINHLNMDLDDMSLLQLDANPRVTLDESNDQDF